MNEFHTDNKEMVAPVDGTTLAQSGDVHRQDGKPTLKDVLFAKDPKQVQAEKKETK